MKPCGRLYVVVFPACRAVPSERKPPLLNPHLYSSSEGCYHCLTSLCCHLIPIRRQLIIILLFKPIEHPKFTLRITCLHFLLAFSFGVNPLERKVHRFIQLLTLKKIM